MSLNVLAFAPPAPPDPMLTELGILALLGVATAFVCLLLTIILLPQGERRYVRLPILLFGAAIAAMIADYTAANYLVRWPVEFIALFFWLAGMTRCLFLFVARSRLTGWAFQNVPRIFMDGVEGLAYLGCVFITMAAAKIDTSSLVAGSAVMAAVIGYLMKDTLGNLLSGLAIQGERPFEVGDWIQFDSDRAKIGKVLEINWRSTVLLTNDLVRVTVPHAFLAQLPLMNFTKPDVWSRRQITFEAPYAEPPERIKHIILKALPGTPGVLEQPAPSIVTSGFGEAGVQFTVRVFFREFSDRDVVEGAVRDRIWAALRREQIPLPFTQREIMIEHKDAATREDKRADKRAERRRVLSCVDFLASLPEPALETLAATLERRFYTRGEVIIRQGDTDSQLFILVSGMVSVQVSVDGAPSREVTRLGPGTFFGEMALMTGAPRAATVESTEGSEVYVIDKSSLGPILAASPDLAKVISQTLASRSSKLEAHAQREHANKPSVAESERHLLDRIRLFFAI